MQMTKCSNELVDLNIQQNKGCPMDFDMMPILDFGHTPGVIQ